MMDRFALTKSQAALLCCLVAAPIVSAVAAESAENQYLIQILDHEFSPKELVVPAGQKIKVMVENLDPTPEEFESYDLHREKMISANSKAAIFIGPLKAGTYKYFGEFHQQTAQGAIVVKEASL